MKDFTKADLKNRMVVECRNGGRYMVVDDRLLSNDGFNFLYSYDEDLIIKNREVKEYDIMKVYAKITILDLESANDILWERLEVKEITMSEIEEKFGCKVKIVKG